MLQATYVGRTNAVSEERQRFSLNVFLHGIPNDPRRRDLFIFGHAPHGGVVLRRNGYGDSRATGLLSSRGARGRLLAHDASDCINVVRQINLIRNNSCWTGVTVTAGRLERFVHESIATSLWPSEHSRGGAQRSGQYLDGAQRAAQLRSDSREPGRF